MRPSIDIYAYGPADQIVADAKWLANGEATFAEADAGPADQRLLDAAEAARKAAERVLAEPIEHWEGAE